MTIPNIMSIFRLLLAPTFAIVYLSDMDHANLIAVAIYVLAGITDVLDGIIARKFNMTSELGKILDPMGDKIMVFVVLLCITIKGVVPVWAIVIFLVKELSMTFGGFFLYRKLEEMPASNHFGKLSTCVFFAVCVILLLFKDINYMWATVLISIALLFMLLALTSYIKLFLKLQKQTRESHQ